MQFYYFLKSKLPILAVLSLMIGANSCGSYQYASQDNDGIYDSETVRNSTEQPTRATSTNSNYYKNYFEEKENQYANLTGEDVIFTDIDSYESDYLTENDTIYQNENYSGWGQESDNVTINVYPRIGYGYSSYWSPYGYNYRNRWSFGWGYGGFYNSFWCPPYYGYGYSSYWRPYHHNYYRPYYGSYQNGYRRGLAYNSSRRSSIYNRSNTRNSNNLSRRTITRRSNSNLNRRDGVQRGRPNTTSRPRVRPNSQSRPKTNTRPRVRPSSQSRPKINRTSSRPRNNNYSRPSSSRKNYSSPRNNSSKSRSSSKSTSRRRG